MTPGFLLRAVIAARRGARFGVFVLLVVGCGEAAALRAGVVYGADDRMEVYAHPNEADRALATDSVVAFFPREFLRAVGDTYELTEEVPLSLDIKRDDMDGLLCPDVAFVDQPSAALCSGTLVAPDLVLTAAHCVPSADACAQRLVVFDFSYEAPGTASILGLDDVYECAERVVVDGALDYAIVRLGRSVEGGHRPAPIDAELIRSGVEGDPLTMFGFPDGVPLKIDAGAQFLRPEGAGFRATLDAFAGGSGAGVFSEGYLVGFVSRGQPDFRLNPERACYEVNVLPASGPEVRGEFAVYADVALDALCDRRPDISLCADPDAWIAGRVPGGCTVAHHHRPRGAVGYIGLALACILFLRRQRWRG